MALQAGSHRLWRSTPLPGSLLPSIGNPRQFLSLHFLKIVHTDHRRRAVLAQPRERRVARDGQQPRRALPPANPSMPRKARRQASLNDILGIRGIADNPTRKAHKHR